jgi:hypothetical protein
MGDAMQIIDSVAIKTPIDEAALFFCLRLEIIRHVLLKINISPEPFIERWGCGFESRT